eukprot:14935_1
MIQLIFMGYYQLSRLHYCFSSSQVHSKQGYPDWLFIIMYSVATLAILTMVITPWIPPMTIYKSCGLNKTYQFYYIRNSDISSIVDTILFNVYMITYLCWEILTLLLYVCKIRSFS